MKLIICHHEDTVDKLINECHQSKDVLRLVIIQGTLKFPETLVYNGRNVREPSPNLAAILIYLTSPMKCEDERNILNYQYFKKFQSN